MGYKKEYYEKNRDAIRAKLKESYRRNKEKRLEYQKKYDDEHREQIRKRHKECKYYCRKKVQEE